MIYLCLFVLFLIYAFCDGAMDANCHLRIHLSKMPLRDIWHIFKHIGRLSLIGVGILLVFCWQESHWACIITVLSAVVLGFSLWNVVYRMPEKWLEIDERLHISTGIGWLDKFLGLHW